MEKPSGEDPDVSEDRVSGCRFVYRLDRAKTLIRHFDECDIDSAGSESDAEKVEVRILSGVKRAGFCGRSKLSDS